MAAKGKVKVGIIGSQFEADIHAASFQMLPEEVEVVGVASPTPGNAEKLAKKYNIPRVFVEYREMLAEPDIEMVGVTTTFGNGPIGRNDGICVLMTSHPVSMLEYAGVVGMYALNAFSNSVPRAAIWSRYGVVSRSYP